jgi:hypothetical protein
VNTFDRLSRAYNAFREEPGVRLREMPTTREMPKIRGKEPYSQRKGTKPFQRLSWHSRRWMPPDVESALAECDRSGQTQIANTISGWVQSDPIVSGIAKGLTMIPHGQVGVLYSDEAAAWLEGTKDKPGMRTQIAPPSELVVAASNEFFGGECVGLLVRDERQGIPVFEALDPVGLRYQHHRRTWQYHGWQCVYDISTEDFVLGENGQWELNPWIIGTLSKNRPWFEGQWHKLAYKVMHAQLSGELRNVFENAFSMPTVLARVPQGSSVDQRAKFTESFLGAFLRVVGVTPGYDIELKQATAEGAELYTQSEKNLIEAASIAIWGTTGLISGGQGFANADLFEQMAAKIISAFAAHLARRDNGQIWRRVLQWAAQTNKISKAAAHAQIEYRTDSAAVIATKAKAAKLLTEVGVSPAEARKQVGLSSLSTPEEKKEQATGTPIFGYHIQGGVVTPNEVRAQLNLPPVPWGEQPRTPDGTVPPPDPTVPPEVREEEEPEPTYSEMVAEQLNARGEAVCPCSNKADRHCPRCGVVRRKEVQDGQWIDTWKPTRRRAA